MVSVGYVQIHVLSDMDHSPHHAHTGLCKEDCRYRQYLHWSCCRGGHFHSTRSGEPRPLGRTSLFNVIHDSLPVPVSISDCCDCRHLYCNLLQTEEQFLFPF